MYFKASENYQGNERLWDYGPGEEGSPEIISAFGTIFHPRL